MTPLRLGTRGSPLALWQADHVADRLRPVVDPRPVELVLIETHGDRDQATALAAMGGFGVFTKAIQNALLDGRADVAVHSLKDLPTIPSRRPGAGRRAAARADRRRLRLAQAPPVRRPAEGRDASARAACAGGRSC